MKKHSFLIASAFLSSALHFPATPALAGDVEFKLSSPVPFKGVAKLVKKRITNKKLDVDTAYPQFLKITPVTRLANWNISSRAKKRYQAFLKSEREDTVGGGMANIPYELDESPKLHCFYAPRLVSTSYVYYQFMRGAHGMNGTIATNFGQFAGMPKPKVLTLGDFFTGTTYRKTIEKKLIDKLRADKQEATWIRDGSVKSFTNNQLNNFTVSPTGLTWYFAPYEVGPYSNGEFETTLNISELGPDFKRSVVLGR